MRAEALRISYKGQSGSAQNLQARRAGKNANDCKNMKKLSAILALSLALFAPILAVAQQSRASSLKAPSNALHPNTVTVKSKNVDNGYTKIVAIVPKDYEENANVRYPVVYLLHGYGDNEQKWIKEKPQLQDISDKYGMIIICPDGKRSWYWDSVAKPELKYETFISKELVDFVDSHYRTLKSPKFRAITGLSMGGHGALWNGLRHPNVFGACGSMSGGVDIRPFPKQWSMEQSLGSYEKNKDVWDAHTVVNLVDSLKPGQSKIIIDCGVADFFYKVNQDLHERLLAKKIPHDYITRPGGHSWAYWKNAIEYQLLFFHNFFKDNAKTLQK